MYKLTKNYTTRLSLLVSLHELKVPQVRMLRGTRFFHLDNAIIYNTNN